MRHLPPALCQPPCFCSHPTPPAPPPPDTPPLSSPSPSPPPPPGDDVCGICRMPFDGCPPDGKFPGDDSPVVWGVCTHAFHLQCINRCACRWAGGWVL